MGRVSLTEDYDDRSVIAKLNEMDKRVTENTTVVTSAEASAKASAQAAQETADRFAGSVGAVVQNANAQINASKAQVDQAKAEVDETVTTVAQAVQTANNASASAQQSAQTVAGYDTRLTAVENADTQNVKLDTNQVITGHKKFVQTSTTGVPLEGERKGNGAGVAVTQTDQNMTASGVQYYPGMYVYDSNGNRVGGWYPVKEENNRTTLRMRHNSANGETRELVIDGDFILSNSMVSKEYVEATNPTTRKNSIVHTRDDEDVNGFKRFQFKPSIKKIYIFNENLTNKFVKICEYVENTSYSDMHMIVRFISGHTDTADFGFTVDIKQRTSPTMRTLTLVDNFSNIPICIGKAPAMGVNNCGLVALYRTHNDGKTWIEVWGKLPSNRVCIDVQNYVLINNLSSSSPGVIIDTQGVGFDIGGTSYVTWDCNTYAEALPSDYTRIHYIVKGKEDVA